MDPQPSIVAAVRRFVEQDVRPAAPSLEHADAYPHALVERMRAPGLFGALVPREYGGLGLDVTTYARVIEEICRGWMSLAGVINSHTMAALIVLQHGTEAQRRHFLPRFAAGEGRGGLWLAGPHAGADVQAIRTRAVRRGDEYLITGTKMFVTNGREGNTFALLAVTDSGAQPRHRGMSCFIVEKGAPGLAVVKSIGKLGYKGVDTAELLFEDFACPAASLVGGVEGRGFGQVMSGLEAGRINIAARAVGVAQAALEEAAARRAGAPRLDDMAARVDAARLLTYWAAAMKDRAERCDLEAGMAKLFASETAHEVALDAVRLCGTSTALAIERCYRDTPLMIIGEGTNEIQRTIIARQLVERHGERGGGLVSRDGEPEERRRMLLAVRQVVEKSLVPVAAEHDREGRVPDEIVAELADLGVFAALVPPAHGRRGRARSRRAGGAAGGGVTARRPASGAPPLVVGAPAPRRGGSRPRRRRRGPRPGGVRGGAALLAAAQHVRQGDLPAPGRAAQARRHGDAADGRAAARGRRGGAGGRRGRRRRRAARAPVRRRRRGGGHARVHADPRRLRLHDGVSRRALLPRRRCAARGRARGRAALMAYGRYFEEFTVGEVLRHWPGRTINEADCTWFALLTMNQHPVHSDAHYAATHTQHGQRLVLGPLVFSIGIGMTVADVSGKAIANLEIEKITHEAPTFIGDTLYSESTVLATRESTQGDRGIVAVETRVSNQRGERVMTFKRTALIPKRNHATLGEGAYPA